MEESGLDGQESHLLERGVVTNIGERARFDVSCPVDSICVCFKSVFPP